MLRRSLAKLVMRAAEDQAKTACGNLQLCAGLKSGKKGDTHAVVQRILERVRGRRRKEESEESEEEDEESVGMMAGINNLSIETAGRRRKQRSN